MGLYRLLHGNHSEGGRVYRAAHRPYDDPDAPPLHPTLVVSNNPLDTMFRNKFISNDVYEYVQREGLSLTTYQRLLSTFAFQLDVPEPVLSVQVMQFVIGLTGSDAVHDTYVEAFLVLADRLEDSAHPLCEWIRRRLLGDDLSSTAMVALLKTVVETPPWDGT